jgi:UDP-N-acetylmuramyl pentapeptide phosphotransferase/UDP-N-acetylglucosamine-1-phosphate transferase
MFDYFINFFLIILITLFINTLLNKVKRLNNFSGQLHQTFTKTKKIPLSGGLILIILIIFKFNLIEINLLYSLLSIFFIGFLADLRILRSPTIRFILQILFILLSIIILDLSVSQIRISWFDELLLNRYFNIFFVLFCFLVLINGSNFIDGNNALAIGYYSLVIFTVLNLSTELSTNKGYENFLILFFISLIVLLIFNIFNQLYLGDGGIYLISTLTGFILILLYSHNQNISPFFVVNLLWYPSFEILFSLIRKLKTQYSPMDPDTQHLHQLIFKKLVQHLKNNFILCNSLTGIMINIYHLIIFYICYTNYSKSIFQIYILTLNIFVYLSVYYLLKKKLFIKK